MKKIWVLFAVTLALSAGAWANVIALGTDDVNAKSTFLEQSSNDNCSSGIAYQCTSNSEFNPLVLNLSNLGLTAGDTIQLILGGSACYTGGTSGCVNEPLGGVFTSTEDLLSSSNQNRLPTQINSGLASITDPNFNTYYTAGGLYDGPGTGLNTEIPDDFYICGTATMPDCTSTTGTTVVIPVGAEYLYIGALDSFYADNSGDLTLTVNELVTDPTPEPAAFALLFAGLTILALVYRRRAAAAR